MSRLGIVVIALFTLVVSGGPLSASAGDDTGRQVLVVDDDGIQCPGADFASVQEAVDAAQDGALVRVCPGVYPDFVTVDKPLTLLGRPNVAALDCFATRLWTSTLRGTRCCSGRPADRATCSRSRHRA